MTYPYINRPTVPAALTAVELVSAYTAGAPPHRCSSHPQPRTPPPPPRGGARAVAFEAGLRAPLGTMARPARCPAGLRLPWLVSTGDSFHHR